MNVVLAGIGIICVIASPFVGTGFSAAQPDALGIGMGVIGFCLVATAVLRAVRQLQS